MRPASGRALGRALVATLLPLAACTASPPPPASSASAGGPVCAFYSGSKGASGSGAQDVVRERRCFRTLAQCRSWLRDVRTRAPSVFTETPCR